MLVFLAAPILTRALALFREGRVEFSVSGLAGRFLRARRLEQVRGQMPELLSLLSTSVRAGLSLPQALASAAREMGGPLGEELARMTEENRLGGTLEEGLDRLDRRVPLPEVRFLAAGLNLARRTGGSLAPLLDRIGETLRERRKLRGEVRAMTAQGRLSGIVVGAAPFVLFAVMAAVDPQFVRPLLVTPAGWLVLATALFLEIIGAIGIRAAVRVEP